MAEATLTKKDFKSDQEVRWCPGCGDYAILNAMQMVLADLGAKREKTVFVSGIGCSSRFPYYMSTYGFHGIHGRAPAIATGVKLGNPELDVWIATGDGDGLSIGGNHLAHILRRNVDLKILMFNNEIYGLTKGQYSPTSPPGTKTKSTPMGSVDRPFNPLAFALGCNATFVARTVDADTKHMVKILKIAASHKGTAFVEILQNCVIFNADFYSATMERDVRDEKSIDLTAGERMVFGKNKDKGLKVEGFEVKIVEAKDADVWDPTVRSSAPAFLMSMMDQDPAMPKPLGIFRSVKDAVYDRDVNAQVEKAIASRGRGKLRDLVWSGETWKVG